MIMTYLLSARIYLRTLLRILMFFYAKDILAMNNLLTKSWLINALWIAQYL